MQPLHEYDPEEYLRRRDEELSDWATRDWSVWGDLARAGSPRCPMRISVPAGCRSTRGTSHDQV